MLESKLQTSLDVGWAVQFSVFVKTIAALDCSDFVGGDSPGERLGWRSLPRRSFLSVIPSFC